MLKKTNSLKTWKKIIVSLLVFPLLIILCIWVAFQVSPLPGVLLIEKAFSKTEPITDQSRFEQASKNVKSIRDIEYTSNYKNNTADIFYKDGAEYAPTIFWIHGGGFVAGDKSGSEEFATYLVEATGYTVVSVNYEKAPSAKYPSQVLQTGDVYKYFKENTADYKMINPGMVMFGGDSAGAQIAAQFALTQTSADYAKEVGISQILDKNQIKGTILFCGPLNLKNSVNTKTENKYLKFFINTVAWSLTGEKNWQSSPAIEQASLVDHLTESYPPSYITDGNAFSFQDQGIEFNEKLNSLGIATESLFFKDSTKQINHEYQFNFTTDEAKKSFDLTVDFVKKYMENK